MPIKNNLKPVTSEMIISMMKSKLLADGFLTEIELSNLVFSMHGDQMKVDGPQSILDKLPQ